MSVRNIKLTLNYDSDHDVMYVSIGQPKPSYCDNDVDGILIRRSADSNRLSGVTIMDFSKRDKELLKAVIPFKIDVNELYQVAR